MTTTQLEPAEGTPLACQCALSRQTLTFVADLLRAHLKKTGSRWRKLPPGKIALIVLATLRHDHRLADMAGGNGVSASSAGRRTWEITGLPAARAPRLDRALAAISRQGGEVVLLDGTLIPTRRRPGAANRSNYNGKHKKHGLPFLALTDESGNLIWISCARRCAASEITAARHDHLAQRQANQALSAARAPVEHGFSDLKNWRILTRVRISPGKATILSPGKATILLRALLVLTRQHTTPLTDDHDLRPAAPTSPSTTNPAHTSPLTSQFRLERSQ